MACAASLSFSLSVTLWVSLSSSPASAEKLSLSSLEKDKLFGVDLKKGADLKELLKAESKGALRHFSYSHEGWVRIIPEPGGEVAALDFLMTSGINSPVQAVAVFLAPDSAASDWRTVASRLKLEIRSLHAVSEYYGDVYATQRPDRFVFIEPWFTGEAIRGVIRVLDPGVWQRSIFSKSLSSAAAMRDLSPGGPALRARYPRDSLARDRMSEAFSAYRLGDAWTEYLRINPDTYHKDRRAFGAAFADMARSGIPGDRKRLLSDPRIASHWHNLFDFSPQDDQENVFWRLVALWHGTQGLTRQPVTRAALDSLVPRLYWSLYGTRRSEFLRRYAAYMTQPDGGPLALSGDSTDAILRTVLAEGLYDVEAPAAFEAIASLWHHSVSQGIRPRPSTSMLEPLHRKLWKYDFAGKIRLWRTAVGLQISPAVRKQERPFSVEYLRKITTLLLERSLEEPLWPLWVIEDIVTQWKRSAHEDPQGFASVFDEPFLRGLHKTAWDRAPLNRRLDLLRQARRWRSTLDAELPGRPLFDDAYLAGLASTLLADLSDTTARRDPLEEALSALEALALDGTLLAAPAVDRLVLDLWERVPVTERIGLYARARKHMTEPVRKERAETLALELEDEAKVAVAENLPATAAGYYALADELRVWPVEARPRIRALLLPLAPHYYCPVRAVDSRGGPLSWPGTLYRYKAIDPHRYLEPEDWQAAGQRLTHDSDRVLVRLTTPLLVKPARMEKEERVPRRMLRKYVTPTWDHARDYYKEVRELERQLVEAQITGQSFAGRSQRWYAPRSLKSSYSTTRWDWDDPRGPTLKVYTIDEYVTPDRGPSEFEREHAEAARSRAEAAAQRLEWLRANPPKPRYIDKYAPVDSAYLRLWQQWEVTVTRAVQVESEYTEPQVLEQSYLWTDEQVRVIEDKRNEILAVDEWTSEDQVRETALRAALPGFDQSVQAAVQLAVSDIVVPRVSRRIWARVEQGEDYRKLLGEEQWLYYFFANGTSPYTLSPRTAVRRYAAREVERSKQRELERPWFDLTVLRADGTLNLPYEQPPCCNGLQIVQPSVPGRVREETATDKFDLKAAGLIVPRREIDFSDEALASDPERPLRWDHQSEPGALMASPRIERTGGTPYWPEPRWLLVDSVRGGPPEGVAQWPRAVWSNDGALLVREDSTLSLHDVRTSKARWTRTAHGELATFTPDRTRLLYVPLAGRGYDDYEYSWTLEWLDPRTGKRLGSKELGRPGNSVYEFHQDSSGRWWSANSSQSSAHTSTGVRINDFPELGTAQVSPDLKFLAAFSEGTLRTRDTAGREIPVSAPGVVHVRRVPDRGQVSFWNCQTVLSIPAHSTWGAVRFGTDSSRMVSCSEDGTALLWDLDKRALVRKFMHGASLEDARLIRNGTRLVTVRKRDLGASVWDVASGWRLADTHGFSGHGGPEVSDDGSFLLGLNRYGKAHLWETELGTVVATFSIPDMYFENLYLSPDGEFVAATGSGRTWIWARQVEKK